ncbi:MAG: flagellar basal body rod protein FlgB [Spirochaetia bacterium]|nr:flagellar basal body rod protein FlgB [Spirochaetia bacterium]
MLEGILSGNIYQILEKSLNASALQQQMISNNIANVDTPGYKRSEVVFQSKLEQALNNTEKNYLPLMVTHKDHIQLTQDFSINSIEPEIVTNAETSMRNDGNNVDIDSEMAHMAENTAMYSSLAELTSMKLGMLKSVITDRGA